MIHPNDNLWFRTQHPHGLAVGNEIVIYHVKVRWWRRLWWKLTEAQPTFKVVEVVSDSVCILSRVQPGNGAVAA